MLLVFTLKGLSQEIRVLQDLIMKDIGMVRLLTLDIHLRLRVKASGRHVDSMPVSAEQVKKRNRGEEKERGEGGEGASERSYRMQGRVLFHALHFA